MRIISWFLLASITSVGAAQDSLGNLVYLNDRLVLHPRAGVAARYDSNVDALTEDPEDETAGIATAGLSLDFAWSEITNITSDVEARLVLTDRVDDRWRNQGSANLGIRQATTTYALGAMGSYARSDEPEEETGERLLTDTYSANVTGELTGQTNRVTAVLGFSRSDYQQASRAFAEDDRDSNSLTLSLGYGLRRQNGDEVTLRAIVGQEFYDSTTSYQDSTGVRGMAGWNRQVSETIGLSMELGAEYRRYAASAGRSSDETISPTWQVSGRTVTVAETIWSLTLGGQVEDTVDGNPALASRGSLTGQHPLTMSWSVRGNLDGLYLNDLESVGGQAKDEQWTARGVVGASYQFRPGLSGDLDGGYEYSDSRIDGNYDRFLVRAGLYARF